MVVLCLDASAIALSYYCRGLGYKSAKTGVAIPQSWDTDVYRNSVNSVNLLFNTLWDGPVIQKITEPGHVRFQSSRWLFVGLVMLAWVCSSAMLVRSAQALPNDIHLHFLFNGRDLDDTARNLQLRDIRQREFANLAIEFGFAIAEPILAPAETLGVAGFDLGVEFSFVNIPENSTHWRKAVEDGRPDDYLMITRIRLRKGLPFSFEIEGTIGFIHNHSGVLAGFGLKWALNEGLTYFPDIGFRLSVNRLFGSRDLDLVTGTADFWMSKQFSVVGMFTITPYAGYSLVFVRASSQVLDPTPLNFGDNEDGSTGSSNFVFKPVPNEENPTGTLGSRLTIGARIVWYFLSLAVEGTFIFPHAPGNETNPGPEMISAFNMKLSFFF